MKKVIGAILVLLAVAGMLNIGRQIVAKAPIQPSGNAAYDTGRKAGQLTGAVILVAIGLVGTRLLLSPQNSRVGSAARTYAPPGSVPPAFEPETRGNQQYLPGGPRPSRTPWLIAIACFAVGAAVLGLAVLGGGFLWVQHHKEVREYSPQIEPAVPDSARQRLRGPAEAGVYREGSSIDARWGGKWIPGKIKSINPGGFTVMVQLEDEHLSHPIVLSTNQIRLQ
jgi:hypothetical protein